MNVKRVMQAISGPMQYRKLETSRKRNNSNSDRVYIIARTFERPKVKSRDI